MTTEEIDRLNHEFWETRRNDFVAIYAQCMDLLREAKNNNYPKGVAAAHRTLGYCYWRFSDFAKAMTHSTKALHIYEQLEDFKGQADCINNIGAVYMFQNKGEERLQANIQCLELRERIGDLKGISGSQNNIGESYFELKQFDKAEEWYKTCLNNHNGENYVWDMANLNLGILYLEKENFPKANHHLELGVQLSIKNGDNVVLCDSKYYLALLAVKENKLNKAMSFLSESIQISEQNRLKSELQRAMLLQSEIWEKKDKLAESLASYKAFHTLYSEIFNEDNDLKIKNLEHKYEMDRVQVERELEFEKNAALQEVNKHLVDSIVHAKRTQSALLGNMKGVSDSGLKYSLSFLPKDIVSGDFYWTYRKDNFLYAAVIDCTGHGVSGAFLTVLGISYLNDIMLGSKYPKPNEILSQLVAKLKSDLKANTNFRDGMDASLVRIDLNTKEASWSGAMRPMWILKNDGSLEEWKGDRQSICYTEETPKFTEVNTQLQKNDRILLFTDGYTDQFGGKDDKKIKSRGLRNLLRENTMATAKELGGILQNFFDDWKGDQIQIDDMCFVVLELN
jgi:serine phosphatase RsbU (regulator of sigma subunit)